MTQEKWEQIVALAKEKFKIESHETEPMEDIPDGTVEQLIFEGPIGRMKLEFSSKPLVLSTKAVGSKRIGSEQTVEYETSDTERTLTFKAYKANSSDGWVEIEAGESFLND
jgi:hypothetical protein